MDGREGFSELVGGGKDFLSEWVGGNGRWVQGFSGLYIEVLPRGWGQIWDVEKGGEIGLWKNRGRGKLMQ